jgi:transposase
VANARKVRLIYASKRKRDEIDAENLARLARLDPKLLYPLKPGVGQLPHTASEPR